MDRLIRSVGLAVLLSIAQFLSAKTMAACNCPDDMVVFGTYESAKLENIQQLRVAALIDSGATTTALDARNIKMYVNRKGRRWVYYDFHHKPTGKRVSMHQPVSRVARIITHSGKPKERAVVMNTVSIGPPTNFLKCL